VPRFQRSAQVSSDRPEAIEPLLRKLVAGAGTVRRGDCGFAVAAELEGRSARELNREPLSELRRAEKRTRLRSQWTSGKLTETFFDYLPKGTRTA